MRPAPTSLPRTSTSRSVASRCTRSIAAATSPTTAPASSSGIPSSISAAISRASVARTLGPVDYVRLLEEVLIRTCGDFGVPDPAHLQAHRRLDAGGRTDPREEDRRHRRPRLAGRHLARLCPQRHDRSPRFRLDRSLRHHGPRGHQPRTRSADRDLQPTMRVGLQYHGAQLRPRLQRQMLLTASLEELLASATLRGRNRIIRCCAANRKP